MILHIVRFGTLRFLFKLYNRARCFIWRASGDFMDILRFSYVTH